MNNNPTILSTKVLSLKNQSKLVASGISVLSENFIQIESLAISEIDLKNNIIITSQNALESVVNQLSVAHLKNRNFYCVGNKTKQKIEELGLKVALMCNYSEELANQLVLNYKDVQFTFLCGTIRRPELPQILLENKINYSEHHVYETKLTPVTITNKLEGVLFYSPSGVKSFLMKNKLENEMCFCIGNTTANALSGITTNCIIASNPSVEKMLEACQTYFA